MLMGEYDCHLASVVLAGGLGRRMGGVDKGLMPYKNLPMVLCTLRVAAEVSNQLVISCNRNQLRYQQFGFPCIRDVFPDFSGPLAGIQSAMHRFEASASHLLVLPCDTPQLKVAQLRELIEMSDRFPEAIIYLSHQGRRHYLHSIIPVGLKVDLENYLEEGGRSVRGWFKQHEVIAVTSRYPLHNVNTYDQLSA